MEGEAKETRNFENEKLRSETFDLLTVLQDNM